MRSTRSANLRIWAAPGRGGETVRAPCRSCGTHSIDRRSVARLALPAGRCPSATPQNCAPGGEEVGGHLPCNASRRGGPCQAPPVVRAGPLPCCLVGPWRGSEAVDAPGASVHNERAPRHAGLPACGDDPMDNAMHREGDRLAAHRVRGRVWSRGHWSSGVRAPGGGAWQLVNALSCCGLAPAGQTSETVVATMGRDAQTAGSAEA